MPLSKAKDRERKKKNFQPNSNLNAELTPIMQALLDPVKRDGLERICLSLKRHDKLDGLRYGIHGPTFDQVSEMLEITDLP